ncbi:MAG: glycosyltransferase family 10 [Roseovarius sp.]
MTRPDGTVAILPTTMKLGWSPAQIALDDLVWPLGQPDALKGGRLADLQAHDHLIVFPRETLHIRPSFGTRAKISVMIMEPAAIHGTHMTALRVTWRRFHKVLSSDEALIAAIPNGVFFPFGSTWVPGWRDLDTTKSKMCSLIASSKRSQTGHVLRHAVADQITAQALDVDLLGGGYAPFGDKSDGLAPYRYSVVIENVAEPNYFTEKLVDAILCNTIPIYWGCPNIDRFFDTSGMVICQDQDDLMQAIHAMSVDDYTARLARMPQAHTQAQLYADFYGRAARAVLGQTP